MPKKSTPVRSGVQRSKTKTSKAFELVRPTSATSPESEAVEVEQPVVIEANETESGEERSGQTFSEPKATATATTATKQRIEDVPAVSQRRSRGRTTQSASGLATLPAVPQKKSDDVAEDVVSTPPKSSSATTASKGSASERLAARRQGSQKVQQRNAATLITAEHYSYVRRDLMFIASLAIIMFIILAVLYFVPGI
ncbi:MAG TPA: hypothetical protein DHW02_10280 [Ktedonobacter sp.]|nr:hypothetical protein [Ktedonobacter sp.]